MAGKVAPREKSDPCIRKGTRCEDATEAGFSPDGKKIALEVSSSPGGIAVANADDGSGPVNVTPNSPGNENAPDWGVNTKPVVSGVKPPNNSNTKDRTPLVRATVSDRQADLAKDDIRLFFDGRGRKGFTYDRDSDALKFRPGTLGLGEHRIRIVANDGNGGITTKSSGFEVVQK